VNRLALRRNADFVELMSRNGHNFARSCANRWSTTRTSTGGRGCRNGRRSASAWPPRSHGLVGERTSKAALDEAQTQVDRIMKG